VQAEAQNNPVTDRYRLEFDEKNNQLLGVVLEPRAAEASDDEGNPAPFLPQPVTLRSLHNQLEEAGYADFYFLNNSVESFLKRIQRIELGSYPLAERRDAKITITVSHDKASARVQTEKAWGGRALHEAKVMASIEKAKLADECIDKQKLAELIAAKEPVDFILATAKPAKDGLDAQLEQLIDSKTKAERDASSDAAIDQHEMFVFTVVEPGTELMRKIPATRGEDGMDVTGKVIRAKPGKDIQFSKPFEGVEPSVQNENLLIAAVKGHPVFNKFGVKVDKMMNIESVNIHSGNIDFDGSLLIKENIEPGFEVNVSGDLFVKGSVSKANVKAGGSIEVSGGVTADDVDDENGCFLEAKGDITAKFFHHVNVECGGDLHVHEYLMQCRVRAEGFINAGQQRGRGCIIGGHSGAKEGVNAKVIGSDAYISTTVCIGVDSKLHDEIRALKQKIRKRSSEEEQLATILEKVQSSNKASRLGQTTLDKAEKIRKTIELLQKKIMEMESKLEELQALLQLPDELAVKVSSYIYPNVAISINGRPWNCEEIRRRCKVSLQGERIAVDPL